VNLDDYCKSIKEIPIPRGQDLTQPLVETGTSVLAALNGQMSWAARQGRAECSFAVSHCQQAVASATWQDIVKANAAVRRLHQPTNLVFKNLGCSIDEIMFVVATDGAHGAMPRGYSQLGVAICAANPAILVGPAPVTLLEWTTSKCKRVVRSSSACEAAGASLGFEHGEYVRALFSEMVDGTFAVRRWQLAAGKFKLILVLDAKTAYDSIRNDNLANDRRAALDLMALKESLADPASHAFCRWVPGPQQLADALTKFAGNSILYQVMTTGTWSLVEDETLVAVRQRQRENQKTYRKKSKETMMKNASK
jgi:hypothetical protein